MRTIEQVADEIMWAGFLQTGAKALRKYAEEVKEQCAKIADENSSEVAAIEIRALKLP